MEDNDTKALRFASAAVTDIDIQFRLADVAGKLQLAGPRDRAWTAYSLARQRLLQAGVIVTDEQLDEIDQLGVDIANAAETMETVRAALKLGEILAKIALV